MKVENGHIVEATSEELKQVWYSQDWYEIMPFFEYIWRLKRRGVTILDENQGENSENYKTKG